VRGYIYIAASGAFWALSATLGKLVFSGRLVEGTATLTPLDPVMLSQARTTISLLVLAPILLMRGGRAALAMPRMQILKCLVLGTLGVAASNFFYYFAISQTSVSVAIIVQYTAPVWVLMYMVTRRLEAPTPKRVSAVILAVVGITLAIGLIGQRDVRINWAGVMAAFAAALSFSFYNVFGHGLVTAYSRWKVLFYALLGSAMFWAIINPPWKIFAAHYSRAQWLFLVVFAFVSMLIPFSFYLSGLRHLDATRAVVTSCLEPVFTVMMAALFIGEALSPWQVVGMALVLVATVVIQLPEQRSQPA
jgi:drug/metabolite transporter (DMT)-like permease